MADPVAALPLSTSPLLVSEREAARLLGLGARTVWGLRAAGRLPFIKVGSAIRYDVADLRAFITAAKTAAKGGGVAS
jgi:excisionase family DNA binding protein